MGEQTKPLDLGEGPTSIKAMTDDHKRQLYEGIRYLEDLEEDIKELRDDSNERKALLREQFGFDNDVLSFVLKRRKKKGHERDSFDDTVKLFEEAMQEVENERAQEARDRIEQASQNAAAKHSEPEQEAPESEPA